MITKILEIKNLGVFKDFKWNRNPKLQEFKEKNIIYGWNYSGKTTLSRIFSSLRDKTIHEDYLDASFILKTDTGEFNSENIEDNTFNVIVFNKEYVNSKITWDSKSKFGEPIAFDVGENVEIRSEIEKLEDLVSRAEEKKKLHQPYINTFEEFEKWRFTNKSKEIRRIISNNSIPFDKGHLKNILRTLSKEIIKDFIINDEKEIEQLIKIANSRNDFNRIEKIVFSPNFEKLKERTSNILKEEPPKDIIIEILEKNKELYDWVHKGLRFEENQEICSFCGNPINPDRIKNLNDYFSNKSKELRNKIVELRKDIENEISAINELRIPKSKNDFTEKVRPDIEAKLKSFNTIKKNYISTLNELLKELERKEDGNIFNNLKLKYIDIEPVNEILDWINNTNDIINEHNEIIENFVTIRDDARNKLKKHLIAEFLKSEKYFEKKEKAEKAKKCIDLYNRFINNKNDSIKEKQDSLKTITKGKDELNKYIQKFLNRRDIIIEVNEDDKFLLLRKGKPAKNLSEGEKTAIAFSYFLVEFESKGIDEMRKTIVFIDDPISSLDTNHIAQVYSLINTYFFRKNIDPEKPDKVINCFKQLFISTHNFDFFSFLKDSSNLKRKKKITDSEGEKREIPNCGFYLIQKIDEENSEIKELPKVLKQYKSEYVYLFSLIYKYYKDIIGGNETFNILIPNALRRFLEIYTLMKVPNESDSVENRIAYLVDDINQFKILNHFSHFTTFEKTTRYDELIMVLPDATKELIKLLELDPKHYEALKKAI